MYKVLFTQVPLHLSPSPLPVCLWASPQLHVRAAGLGFLLLLKIVMHFNNATITSAFSKVKAIWGAFLIHTLALGFLCSPYLPSPPTLILWFPLPPSLVPSGSSSHINLQQAAFISTILRSSCILFLLLDSELSLCCSGSSSFSSLLTCISVPRRFATTVSLGTQSFGVVYKVWQSSAGQLSPDS